MVAFFFDMLKLNNLDKSSLAYRFGFRQNDTIIKFNEKDAIDMLDVAFYDCQAHFTATVLRDGAEKVLTINKASYQPLDWEFYEQCYIEPRWCANKCLFCFVDQLPKGQRETLYVKDDDWRLSFISGNYVTLSNVKDSELDRICENKYSPLYISVHATDSAVRRQLLGNPRSRDILPILERFSENDIIMHTQVVMAPGYNGKEVLLKTMTDLFALYPKVATLAVVPVGLTKHRNNLCEMNLVGKQLANETIDMVEKFDSLAFAKTGQHFVYCSDEFYVTAERELPSYDYYGDFDQIENGIGLIADLRYQFDLAFQDAMSTKKKAFTMVTGVSAKRYLEQLVAKSQEKFPEMQVNVVSITNNFFGETVTVAGLVVGSDIVDQLSIRNDIADTIILPRVMLREIEDVFLDGMTLEELKTKLQKEVIVVADGYELCQAIMECE